MNKLIAVVGANGKMGSIIVEKLSKKYEVIKIDKNDNINLANYSDLVVDFSTGKNSASTAKFCSHNKIPLIIGATGQTGDELEEIKKHSKFIPIMIESNFSIGIQKIKNVIKALADESLESVTIYEKHHCQKKDKPSGTAISLDNYIKDNCSVTPQILSQRGGKEIGTHEIFFYYENEVVTISHQAFSRDAFADGVVLATDFMLQKIEPKLYKFCDI